MEDVMGTPDTPDEQDTHGQAIDRHTDAGQTATSSSWRRLRRRVDGLTNDVAADIEHGWPVLLAWAAGGGLVVAMLCRLVLTFTINARTGIAVVGVVIVTAVAVACLTGLVWASWRIHLDPTTVGPYGVALAISLVAIGICTEAFAAFTTLLLRYDVGAATPGIASDLWRTERFSLWHLAASVPLLKIPETVQWPEPSLLASPTGGGLLLAYKVLLIGPLVRIGISTYQMAANRVLKREEKQDDLARHDVLRQHFWVSRPRPYDPDTSRWELAEEWAVLAASLAFIPILVWLVGPGVFEPGARVDAWMARWLDSGDFAFLRTVPQWIAALLRTAPQWIAAGALAIAVFTAWLSLMDARHVRHSSELAATVLWYLTTIGYVALTGAALNLALLHVGLASATPPIAPGEQVRAAVAAYAWHLADILPALDVPDTLDWTLRHTFTDRWSTTLILLSKLGAVILLIVTVAQAMRSLAHHAKPRPTTPGALNAAEEFAQFLASAREAANRTTAGPDRNDRLTPVPQRGAKVVRDAELILEQLEAVTTLFGPSEATQRADAAAGVLHRRLEPVFYGRTSPLPPLRQEEERLLTAYRDAACQALEAASDRVRFAMLDRSDGN
jgi:hypothetical protein